MGHTLLFSIMPGELARVNLELIDTLHANDVEKYSDGPTCRAPD
jgi:hypothetical protein